MRYTIASLIAFLIVFCDQTQGNLLQQRYNIDGPVHSYDDMEFVMDFEVSDFIRDSMLDFTLYDGLVCKDGGDNDITDNDGYLLSRIRTDNTPNGEGSKTRKIKFHSEIVGSKMVQSGIYRTDSDGNGVVEYCVRFAIYNMEKSEPRAFEANFLEIPVKLVIELNGGFSVNAALSNVDRVIQEAKENVAVEAYICDRDDNIVPITATAQGQTIRICVSPTPKNLAAGALMRQLEAFTFRREIPISTKQVAIEPETGGVPSDQLTVVSCRPGYMVCAFETLLQANFFTGPGVISGQGMAFLQLGPEPPTSVTERRLERGPNEALGEKATGFSIDIQLVPLESLRMDLLISSAPSTTFAVPVLLTLGGIILSTVGLL